MIPKTVKWYDTYAEKKYFLRFKVHCWTNEPARLNSCYSRAARQLLPSAPTSGPKYQDTPRRVLPTATSQGLDNNCCLTQGGFVHMWPVKTSL